MKAVIMAGGRGTRIASAVRDVPKPMIRIAGKPVLERAVECLRREGIREIILTISHLGEVIRDYFGDGSRWGVHISYFYEDVPMGNAGALFWLRDALTEDFLLLNGDLIFDVDLARMAAYHRKKGGLATLLTHPNSHPYDSGLLTAGADMAVSEWLTKEDERPRYYKNRVNAGIHILSPEILGGRMPQRGEKIDLDRHILKPLAGTGKMFCYDSPEYVRDMGTPERLLSVTEDLLAGRVREKNLRNKQRAVFLDRDGTINRYVGFLKNIEDFALLEGVPEAVNMLHEKGYLCIVATNQPVVARGEVTEKELEDIHNKMETLLGLKGAYIDGLYVCPHHPDKGYEGEVAALKIDCPCRKPKPGMLFRAARDFNICLADSWMAGDQENDVRAGKNAGCRTVLIGREGDFGQDMRASSLLEFARRLPLGL